MLHFVIAIMASSYIKDYRDNNFEEEREKTATHDKTDAYEVQFDKSKINSETYQKDSEVDFTTLNNRGSNHSDLNVKDGDYDFSSHTYR